MDITYIIGPILLIAVVLAAVWLDRWSVPVILVALGTGIVFGSDVLNLWNFGDMVLTHQVANIALIFILFQGGFSTKRDAFKSVALPAGGLATWGVILTAAASFGFLYGILGWPFEQSILLAVIISSTDAAATFSILRRQSLPTRLSSTLEIESAANDPMAILLTVMAVQSFTSGAAHWYLMIPVFLWKFAVAPVVGWGMGRATIWLFNRLRPHDRGHYHVLFLGIILLVYGLAELMQTSGMLAVFICGFVIGNHSFVYKQGVANFSSALSTIANIGMFALMGLLVFPHQWSTLWVQGIVLFFAVTFVARPAAIWLGTLGMGLGAKNKVFLMWAGLRGAVPIILATYPAAAGMAIGQDIFNLVFFAVLLSVLVQGSTLGVVAGWLGLSIPSRPKPLYNLELITMAESDLDLVVVDLPDPRGAVGPMIRDLRLPPEAVVTMITRGNKVIAPRGSTHLQGWDQVTVLAHAKDEPFVRQTLLEPFDPVSNPSTSESKG